MKLRAAGGGEFAKKVEEMISSVVHRRGTEIPAADIAGETRRIRFRLEKERAAGSDVNIKYGPGGMLDIYFAIRFLQLRDNIPDVDGSRSSGTILDKLLAKGSLSAHDHEALRSGYDFLSSLDHAMRLINGRSHVLPHAGTSLIRKIVARLRFDSVSDFHQQLSLHRIAIREAFDSITA